MMNITVAICTWNRADLLDQTFEGMRALCIPDDVDWEVLVVNNNCTDHTSDVVGRHLANLPLREVVETNQGHSHSRNRAVREAHGDLTLWTDDDVRPDSCWLAEIATAASKHPECAFFGGPVRAWPEVEMPEWLADIWPQVSQAYAVRDFGAEAFAFSHDRLPFGANFAVRTEVLRCYPFDPMNGRVGTGMRGGDETTVLRAMLNDGFKGQWVPAAGVDHFIPAERMTMDYLRRYFEGQGETQMLQRGTGEEPRLFGAPRWMLRAAFAAELRYRWERLTRQRRKWIASFVEASQWHGRLKAARAVGRSSQANAC